MDSLVTTDWLADHLGDPAVKILDLKKEFSRLSDEYNIDIRFEAVIS